MATPTPDPSSEKRIKSWAKLIQQANTGGQPVPAIDVRHRVRQQITRELDQQSESISIHAPTTWWDEVIYLTQWRWAPAATAIAMVVIGYMGWTLRDVADELDLYAEVHQVLMLDL